MCWESIKIFVTDELAVFIAGLVADIWKSTQNELTSLSLHFATSCPLTFPSFMESLSVSIYIYIHLSVYLSVCLSIYLPIIYPFLALSVYLPNCNSVRLPVCLPLST